MYFEKLIFVLIGGLNTLFTYLFMLFFFVEKTKNFCFVSSTLFL